MCLVRGIYVVKFGATVTENEGNALLFVERHVDIPAPRLHAMYRDPSSGHLHLVMEYIQGVHLESVWESLSGEAKSSIAAQLRPVFAQMRSLSPPRDFIGGVCGGGIPDPIFQTDSPDPSVNGPFKTPEEVGSALALLSRRNWENSGRRGWISSFFSRHLATALKGHAVHFTHGDLHMRNVLVERVLTEPMAVEPEEQCFYRVSGIVDWESAGWFPAYWEYASSVARFHSGTDWPETVEAVIKPYPLELSMFLLVLQDLQFI